METSIHSNLLEQFYRCFALLQRGQHVARREQPGPEGMIHRGQARLLEILLHKDGIAQKEIVDLLDIRPSSAGELVGKLEQQGLAQRREDPADRRIARVYLTEAGRTQAQAHQSRREERSNACFDGLSEAEQAQLGELLGKLASSLKEKTGGMDVTDPRHHGHGHGHDHGHGPHHGGRRDFGQGPFWGRDRGRGPGPDQGDGPRCRHPKAPEEEGTEVQ